MGFEPTSGVRGHGLANRLGQPYPTTFRYSQWTDRESNPGLQFAELVSSHWTISPCFKVDRMGVEPGHRRVAVVHRPCKGQSPPGNMPAHIFRGPSGNRTRSPSLPRTCAAKTPTDRSSSVIPAGIEPALSCMSRRHLHRWTTGSACSDRSGSRTHRHEALDLVAFPVCVPGLVSDQGESRTPKPKGHDVLSVARLPVAPLGRVIQ